MRTPVLFRHPLLPQTGNRMLAEELLLLALDDDKGSVSAVAEVGLEFGLAGSIIMELALRERLHVGEDGVAVTDAGATDSDVLDDALATMAAKPGKDVEYWVNHLPDARQSLKQRLLDGLVHQGTLERREKRVLFVFRWDVFPERDGRVERDIRDRIDSILLRDGDADPRTRLLIKIASSCGVLEAVYPSDEHNCIKARVEELNAGRDVYSDAVQDAMQAAEAAQAAAMVAIMAASMAATTAATSAACASAVSASCS